MSNYSQKLFNQYYEFHGKQIDSDIEMHLKWFYSYYYYNYKRYFEKIDRESNILEIGCNKGLLLHILSNEGFSNIHGVDLSVEDIKTAKDLNSNFKEKIHCVDAKDFLNEHSSYFDVIILKAVLEHVKKDEIIPLLELIKYSLKDGGIVLIDVPNMDWIFSGHERYMDFTHEVGFTRESLSQVLRSVFGNAEVNYAISSELGKGIKYMFRKIFKPFLYFIVSNMMKIIDREGAETWWNYRSIVALSKKNSKPLQ